MKIALNLSMELNKKNSKASLTPQQKKLEISGFVGSYEKHPFFIKKVNIAKDILNKVGLPKEFLVKHS